VFFALEVVVKERLVDTGFLGDLSVRAPASPFLAELADGGIEDSGAGVVGAFV